MDYFCPSPSDSRIGAGSCSSFLAYLTSYGHHIRGQIFIAITFHVSTLDQPKREADVRALILNPLITLTERR